MAGLFAALTIFISCLGLFGLAELRQSFVPRFTSFVPFALLGNMAENRVKEIGVRKVLGASVAGIAALLSKEFLKLVLLSFVVAAPVAWLAMYTWLKDYPYRVEIKWWVFATAAVLTVGITVLTVSYQTIRAALANPARSLRSE